MTPKTWSRVLLVLLLLMVLTSFVSMVVTNVQPTHTRPFTHPGQSNQVAPAPQLVPLANPSS